MSNVPAGLRYAKSHEWLKIEADDAASIGITDYAQASQGRGGAEAGLAVRRR
jgi:glycine cleavage system H protein